MRLHLQIPFYVLSSFSLPLSRAAPAPNMHGRASGSLDSFIATESPLALNLLLANIGPNGANDQGAASGIVIASPSQTNPDCRYA